MLNPSAMWASMWVSSSTSEVEAIIPVDEGMITVI
jgi:hypothetical protein